MFQTKFSPQNLHLHVGGSHGPRPHHVAVRHGVYSIVSLDKKLRHLTTSKQQRYQN